MNAEDALPNEIIHQNQLPPTVNTAAPTIRPALQYGRYSTYAVTHSHHVGGWDREDSSSSRRAPYSPQSYRPPYPPQRHTPRYPSTPFSLPQRPAPTTVSHAAPATSTPPNTVGYASNLELHTTQAEVRAALVHCGSMSVALFDPRISSAG